MMPYASALNLNPAFAGNAGCSRALGGYRNQWPNVSGNYISSYLSYDQYVKGITGGLGVYFLHDEASLGSIVKNRIAGNYSYHSAIPSRKLVMAAGFEAAYVQKIGRAHV